ncbi:hypothetical protein C8F01DRAFT_1236355 [Mycena amicta]|nr:hypothetical protein C8F01DRAFT_1236355 [Mycena amicta]
MAALPPPPIEGVDATMPAWFQIWDATQFQPLRTVVDRIETKLAIFKAQTIDGHGNFPFSVVLFPNGDDPTLAPHNLPALHSLADIKVLTAAQLTAYLLGYELAAVDNPGRAAAAAARRRIARHVGYLAIEFGPLLD